MMTARAMDVLFSAALGMPLLCGMGTVQAKLVAWTLQNAQFVESAAGEGGGTASGFFVVDNDACVSLAPTGPCLIDFDIKVTARPGLSAFEYKPSTTSLHGGGNGTLSFEAPFSPTVGRDLQLNTSFFPPWALAASGGTFVLSSASYEALITPPGGNGGFAIDLRQLAGEITTVPELSEALLLAFGLSTLVGFSARSRH
jgi:hypothetical protein